MATEYYPEFVPIEYDPENIQGFINSYVRDGRRPITPMALLFIENNVGEIACIEKEVSHDGADRHIVLVPDVQLHVPFDLGNIRRIIETKHGRSTNISAIGNTAFKGTSIHPRITPRLFIPFAVGYNDGMSITSGKPDKREIWLSEEKLVDLTLQEHEISGKQGLQRRQITLAAIEQFKSVSKS